MDNIRNENLDLKEVIRDMKRENLVQNNAHAVQFQVA